MNFGDSAADFEHANHDWNQWRTSHAPQAQPTFGEAQLHVSTNYHQRGFSHGNEVDISNTILPPISAAGPHNAPSDRTFRMHPPYGGSMAPMGPPAHTGYGNPANLPSITSNSFDTTSATNNRVTGGGRRNASKALEWEKYKPDIKKIYLDDDQTLEETMRRMQASGFTASEKLYKAKFKEWQWAKHLSGKTAHWMLNQAQKRKRDDKETVFKLGEQVLSMEQIQRSADRAAQRSAKKSRLPLNSTDGKTPAGISYYTPSAGAPSPYYTSPAGPTTPPDEVNNEVEDARYPRFTWNGNAKSHFNDLRIEAQRFEIDGYTLEAQEKYREALSGFQNLLPYTHQDTISLAYELAELYGKTDNMKEADQILELVTKAHINDCGTWSSRTVEHLTHVIGMLQGWSRGDEAVPLIEHLLQGTYCRLQTVSVSEAILENPEGAGVEHHLVPPMVNHVRVDNNLNEAGLISLVERCEDRPTDFPEQAVRSWTALVRVYVEMNDGPKKDNALNRAAVSIRRIMDMEEPAWSMDLFRSILALMQLFVEAKRNDFASRVLSEIEERVEFVFGNYEERTIRVLADIGLLYQNKNMWAHARPYFEHAQAACAAAYGRRDERTKRFENALDNGHYEPSPRVRY